MNEATISFRVIVPTKDGTLWYQDLKVPRAVIESGSVDVRAMLIGDATCQHGPEFWDIEKARVYELCDGTQSRKELKP